MKKFIILIFILFVFPLNVFAGNRINVAFTIDNNYALYTLIAIDSILKNNTSGSEYKFYIVNDHLSAWNKLKLKLLIKHYRQQVEFIKVDTTVVDNGDNLFNYALVYTKHITRIGYARILLPKLLSDGVEKVLYLDADILCLGDLSELFNTDLGENYAAMVNNIIVGTNIRGVYYNSGMILMDLEKWRKYDVAGKLVNVMQNQKLEYPDQDAINIVLRNKIKPLSPIWNKQTILRLNNKVNNDDKIIHYISKYKPWLQYPNIKMGMDNATNLYYDNWRHSIFVVYMPCAILHSVYDDFLKQFCRHIVYLSTNKMGKLKSFAINVREKKGFGKL